MFDRKKGPKLYISKSLYLLKHIAYQIGIGILRCLMYLENFLSLKIISLPKYLIYGKLNKEMSNLEESGKLWSLN